MSDIPHRTLPVIQATSKLGQLPPPKQMPQTSSRESSMSSSRDSSLSREPESMSNAITISHAFDLALPAIPIKKNPKDPVTSSAASSFGTMLPRFWLLQTAAVYVDIAKEILEKSIVKRQTITNCMAPLDPMIVLQHEGDVVNAGGQQVLNPVNVAFKALHNAVPELYMQSEFTSTTDPGDDNDSDTPKTKGSKNQKKKGKPRPDVIWKAHGQVFAVLEYKNINAIDLNEFSAAALKLEPSSHKETIIKAKKENVPTSRTLFTKNSLQIMRQLSKYARHEDFSPFAAILTYEQLFLADYWSSHDGDYIHGTLLSREGNDEKLLRKALLGWLAHAYNKTFGVDPDTGEISTVGLKSGAPPGTAAALRERSPQPQPQPQSQSQSQSQSQPARQNPPGNTSSGVSKPSGSGSNNPDKSISAKDAKSGRKQ
ncbi:hypothetical protein B0T24DRAFT_667233 [Lasiosphaeria ovina]|uniref:Uncharacterized protein n=1 Tax=Lasiosphaeria ovina TaxID=92902 RepID=A0AAE0KC65_9PEZI|nr:hypothetical protein B0T24DRAFT_667233 [Lasiosphaeria ovina]